MKKITLISSLTLSLMSFMIPTVQAANITDITDLNDPKLNIPGVKITHSETGRYNRRVERNKANTEAKDNAGPGNEYDSKTAPPPPTNKAEQSSEETLVSGSGFTGSKPVSVPETIPQQQNIQLPQSMNDVEEIAKTKKSQGQVPYSPPQIIQGNLQTWNTSTINQLEAMGRANAEKNYQEFRSGRR